MEMRMTLLARAPVRTTMGFAQNAKAPAGPSVRSVILAFPPAGGRATRPGMFLMPRPSTSAG